MYKIVKKLTYNLKRFNMNLYIDLDGTILDVSERYYLLYYDVVSSSEGNPLSKREYWKLKKEKVPERDILERSNVDDIPNCIQKRLDNIESAKYLEYDRPFAYSLETLLTLKKLNRLVLVTLRRSKENLYMELSKLKLIKVFDMILTINLNDYGEQWVAKSDLIRNDSSFDKNSIIIGDTEVDICAGKDLGIKTVAVLTGIRTKKILSDENPDYIIRSIRYLPDIIHKDV